MDINKPYNGALTAEQFLFYEIRIVARFYLQGISLEKIIELVLRDNFFQYPTEREVARMTKACYKRIKALNNENLIYELANAPIEVAKQINLYAMMCYSRLVYEFMVDLIGDKFRQHDFNLSKKDINLFFLSLREQNDDVAAWSEKTIAKLKQVLIKCLIETEMLENYKDQTLNPIFISAELERGIRENNDIKALSAFNCFS